jgi:exosome complex component RRP46
LEQACTFSLLDSRSQNKNRNCQVLARSGLAENSRIQDPKLAYSFDHTHAESKDAGWTLVQLVVQSLTPSVNFGDALIAAMINASTLALMNAGSIPMRGVVCAVSIRRTGTNSSAGPTLVLDPSDDEFPSLKGGGCFPFLLGAGQKGGSEVVWSNGKSTAPFDEQDLIRARDLARGGAEKVWKQMKEGVRWVGKEKPLPTQINVVREVSDSEDDSDDDEMEI